MKFTGIADAITASALDLAWLYHALEPVSAFGRRLYDTIEPFDPGEEDDAQRRASEVADLARKFTPESIEAMRDALRSSPDPSPALARASMDETLEDVQFLEILRFVDAARRVELVTCDTSIDVVASALEPGRAGKFGFYLSDEFSNELAEARAQADREEAAFQSTRGRIARRIADELGRGEITGDEFIIMRDGRSNVPHGVRVVREAPTYYLCELELDDEALAALERREEASNRVAEAEQSQRERLSSTIRWALEALKKLLDAMANADVVLAQVRFCRQHGCVAPRVTTEQRLCFKNGAYLPLMLQLNMQGRAYERIDVDLHHAAVLTGPNMGGKSAALRTCGFIAVMVAFGLPVPASEAQCALFDDVAWIGVGADDETKGLLSSYASEVVRLQDVLSRPARRSLVLLDEFARTTTPHEGGALLVAVLKTLRQRGRLAFAATHLEDVARLAGVAHYAVRGLRELPKLNGARGNLLDALDELAKSMDYSVIEADREYFYKESDALALAQLLGLDEEIVARAKETTWIR